jgi:hypothetical protein
MAADIRHQSLDGQSLAILLKDGLRSQSIKWRREFHERLGGTAVQRSTWMLAAEGEQAAAHGVIGLPGGLAQQFIQLSFGLGRFL